MDDPSFLSAMVNETLKKAYSGHRISEVLDMRDLRAVSGPVWEGSWRVDSEVNMDPFWTLSRKPHGNLIFNLRIAFIWP